MADKKYVLITGGSSGLGFAFAKNLVQKRYVPILIARNKNRLDEAVDNINKMGFDAYGLQGDITSESDLTSISEIIKKQFGKIEFLVLNAGIVSVGLLSDYDDYGKMKKVIEIDLWGTILSTRIFMPLLEPGSKILMISSAFGLMGAAGYSTYCAAKAGIINFAEAVRRELLCKNISVYVACPADIDTPQYAEEIKSMPEWMSKGISARHSLLSPEKAAEKILDKCKGKKFLITINFEISLLRILGKILPTRILTKILDSSFPRPRD